MPGPTLVLTGGVHGDEPAGARAAEQILQWPILKGRLVVIPRANVPGLKAGKRLMPGAKEEESNLNRNFPKSGGENDAKGELATELWRFVSSQDPDWLVDLHEGYDFHQLEPETVGSSIIDSNSEASDAAAPAMLAAVNASITNPKRSFVNLGPPVDGSLARAAAEQLGASTMILETTSRDQPLSLRTRQHRTMVRELLVKLGMLAAEPAAGMVTPPALQGPRVAIYDDNGVGGGQGGLEATVAMIPESLAWRVGAADVQNGALSQFDLVIFPGGSGSSEAKALGEKGRGEVRRFVEGGGGYVGICAGAYLSASNYEWSLALSNQRTFAEMREIPGEGSKSMWYRGDSATVSMELSDAGKRIFGELPGEIPVVYHNGPVIPPLGPGEVPSYEVLAWFRSEVSRYEPQKGTMTGTPAMISAHYGKGRVLAISPHPEATKSLRPMLAKGLQWAAGK
ncbi:succinylglutamate desuccinylase/aspartoacylase family protein [Luteolibacter sp. Populi]|uniref:BPL-N domain-containing protein n=1 Tax=Luteolibacter sp. Populi TaxID=3230487 RepID=UPI0034679AA2